MKWLTGFRVYCVLAIAIALPMTAFATTTTYTDEAEFLTIAWMLDLESFEGEEATNGYSADTIVLTDFSVTGTGQYSPCIGIWNEDFVGGFATDGVNWLGYQSDADAQLIFEFTEPINAFGINITDWGDFGEGTLTFSNEVSDVFQVSVTPHPNGDLQFFGVINDLVYFTTVTFTQTISGEFYGVDEIYYGGIDVTAVENISWGSAKSLFSE